MVAAGAVAVEDLHAGPLDEAALFHLLNLAGERRVPLLMTSRAPAAALRDTPARPRLAAARRASGRTGRARRRAPPPRAGQAVRRPAADRRPRRGRLPSSSRMERSLEAANRIVGGTRRARRWPRGGRSRGRLAAAALARVIDRQPDLFEGGEPRLPAVLAKSSYSADRTIIPRGRTDIDAGWTRRTRTPPLRRATIVEFDAAAGAAPARAAGAFHQPRAVVAALQPAGARGGEQPQPSAARAAALPVDLGQQPRRILHGARRRPEGPAAPGHRHGLRRRPVAERAARRASARRSPASPATSRRAGRSCARELDEAGIVLIDASQHRRRRPRLAGAPFPRFDLPGADAARHRPGASVSRSSPISASPSPCRLTRKTNGQRMTALLRMPGIARPLHPPAVDRCQPSIASSASIRR